MSAFATEPQKPALVLTKKSPPPAIGVGQKSLAAELTGAPTFIGAPHEAALLARRATQMSMPPSPPGRFEAMYRLSPSGDSIGQPSSAMVLSSTVLPAISSIFCAGAHTEKCGPPAQATAASDAATATTPATATAARLVTETSPLSLWLNAALRALQRGPTRAVGCRNSVPRRSAGFAGGSSLRTLRVGAGARRRPVYGSYWRRFDYALNLDDPRRKLARQTDDGTHFVDQNSGGNHTALNRRLLELHLEPAFSVGARNVADPVPHTPHCLTCEGRRSQPPLMLPLAAS